MKLEEFIKLSECSDIPAKDATFNSNILGKYNKSGYYKVNST